MRKIFSIIIFLFAALLGQAQNRTVTIRAMIQGFYRPELKKMVAVIDQEFYPTLCDTMTVNLFDTLPNYPKLFSSKSVISTDGEGTFNFPDIPIGRSYFIQLVHRNSLAVFSKYPVFFNSSKIFYDFTTLPVRFCGCADSTHGVALMCSGDVDQRGYISSFDVTEVDNDNLAKIKKGYHATDVTGDGFVNEIDVLITDSNNLKGSIAGRPYKCSSALVSSVIPDPYIASSPDDEVVKVFMNQMNGNATVIFESNDRISGITLYDMSGKRVLKQESIDAGSFLIDMKSFSSGIYICEVRSKTNKQWVKILKQ